MASPTSRGDAAAGAIPQPLAPADLLGVWEEGAHASPVARALTILRRALPAVDAESLADLPVGRRDTLLLQLRELNFGPVADCVSACPACQTTIEFPVAVRDLLVEGSSDAEGIVEWEGLRLRIRAATSRDQLSLAGLSDPAVMTEVLLQRCASVDESTTGTPSPVPIEAVDVVASTMTRLDPGADLRFSLSCPACRATWTSLFDAVSFLWREIDAAARRLLSDVHVLATAYGWSESEILNLPPARRRAYLQLAGPS